MKEGDRGGPTELRPATPLPDDLNPRSDPGVNWLLPPLLYGRRPCCLLDVAKVAWEQQPSPHQTLVEHVGEVRDQMAILWPLSAGTHARRPRKLRPYRTPEAKRDAFRTEVKMMFGSRSYRGV